MRERGGSPKSISDVIQAFLSRGRIGRRVEQAEVLKEWSTIVGEQIASVTEARSVGADGTLLVYVKTHAWMTELSLREPEILTAIQAKLPGINVIRIRWLIWR